MSWGERVHRVREAYLRRTAPLDKSVEVTKADQLLQVNDLHLLTSQANSAFFSSAPSGPYDTIFAYGKSWPLDKAGLPQWHVLLNGSDASDIPTFKVHYRNSANLNDDLRINWELNRLTWLIPSAIHAHSTQDQSARHYVVSALESYLDSDRVGYGTRWNSSIELAMQALSLIIIAGLLDVPETLPALHEQISSALLTRYEWMERFPSKYSSANNHLLAELAALSVVSGVTPSLRSQHAGYVNEFAHECAKQFNEDGLNAELATDYHLYALDLMATVLYFSPQTPHRGLQELTHKVAQATKSVVDFCGFWPRISDSDHAAVLSNVTFEENRAEWLTNFCASLLGAKFASTPGDLLSFKTSGYSFLKSSTETEEILMLLDHGYLGYGDIAGHAHADSAAIWVWMNHQPLLVESGTYSYHSRDELRDCLRSSMWHNTISLNGASTSTPDGPFLWLREKRASAKLLSISDEAATIEVDIPKNPVLPSGATHRRNVSLVGQRIEVIENVSAKVDFELASHLIFECSYSVSVASEDGYIHLSKVSENHVTVTYDPSQVNSLIETIETSPAYGKLEKSTRITFTNKHKSNQQTLAYTLECQLQPEKASTL